MSTIEDFENAPVGATATSPDGRQTYRRETKTQGGADWANDKGEARLWADADGLAHYGYTLDPLPDPEPDWLDAPAVTAVHETHYSVPSVWVPHLHQKGDWTNAITGKTFPWQELTDVTPLYPKENS